MTLISKFGQPLPIFFGVVLWLLLSCSSPTDQGLRFPEDCGSRAPESWEDRCNQFAHDQYLADRYSEFEDSMREATIEAMVAEDLTMVAEMANPTDEETPSPPRGCPGGCTTLPTWCDQPIKGNVSFNTNERIYHMPSDEFYEETVINPDYGEYYFCTQEEAEAAGFRHAYN